MDGEQVGHCERCGDSLFPGAVHTRTVCDLRVKVAEVEKEVEAKKRELKIVYDLVTETEERLAEVESREQAALKVVEAARVMFFEDWEKHGWCGGPTPDHFTNVFSKAIEAYDAQKKG